MHLASRQSMCSCFPVGPSARCLLHLLRFLVLPQETGKLYRECSLCVGAHSNLGGLPRGRSHSYRRGALLTRVLQQALGAAVLSR